MTRYRITVRGDNIELRGYIDADEDHGHLVQLANAVERFGVVVASKAEDDYNPFRAIAGGQEEWIETINEPPGAYGFGYNPNPDTHVQPGAVQRTS